MGPAAILACWMLFMNAVVLQRGTSFLVDSPPDRTREQMERVQHHSVMEDDDRDFILEAHSLTEDPRHMATIGNGHLATAIGSDAVYMNGLFNGRGGLSHRAKLQSRNNLKLTVKEQLGFNKVYSLDCQTGIYTEKWVTNEGAILQMKTLAHRHFTRVILTEISLQNKDSLVISLSNGAFNNTGDVVFQPEQNLTAASGLASGQPGEFQAKFQQGETNETEHETYQKEKTKVFTYWTDVVNDSTITISENTPLFVIYSADTAQHLAREEFEEVLRLTKDNPASLVESHAAIWRKEWENATIKVEGNKKLQQTIYASLYYILSSLPSDPKQVFREQNQFYGLSPGSLAYGGLLEDYEGHNFWDTEIWMYPNVLLFWPERAKSLLDYRVLMSVVAKDLAAEVGCKGIRFPWESAFTGSETTQPCCPEVAEFQHHITGSIAFAFRQLIAVTRDVAWLNRKSSVNQMSPLDVIRGMAEFWASRAEFNETTKMYDINRVMPPDEDHYNISNSIYTNVVAGYAIYFAKYAHCLAKSAEDIPSEWLSVAKYLALPFDPKNSYHPEYDGYQKGEIIKQADVVLLGYPLQYPMDDSIRRNDLAVYEDITRASGPAMTWSMHAIGHLEVGQPTKATALFEKSYAPYVREPFKIWSEVIEGVKDGAVNFITGAGGFLQAVLNGYLGIRIQLESMSFKPQLPPGSTRFLVRGIRYLGNSLTIEVKSDSILLTVQCQNPDHPLVLTQDQNVIHLKENSTVRLASTKFRIESTTPSGCDLPDDRIGGGGPSSGSVKVSPLPPALLVMVAPWLLLAFLFASVL